MSKLKKIILLFLLAVFLFSGIFSFVFATEVPLPGWDPEAVGREELLPEYIRYIFNLSLMLIGLIAFGVLVYAGFSYLTSAGNPTQMSDALDRIWAALLGLVLLLGSYLILVTIDPELVMPRLEPLIPAPEIELTPGVYLIYEEAGEEKFFGPFLHSVSDLRELRGKKIERIKIVNPTIWDSEKGEMVQAEHKFGAIIYEATGHRGACGIFLSSSPISNPYHGELNIEVSSITIFQTVEKGRDGFVTLYSRQEQAGDYKTFERPPPGIHPLGNLKHNVNSIKIDGPYLAVLFGDRPTVPTWGGARKTQCRAFFHSVPDLKGDPINRCKPHWVYFWVSWRSCATEVAIFPL